MVGAGQLFGKKAVKTRGENLELSLANVHYLNSIAVIAMRVFVLLFVNAQTNEEGIHTLRIGDRNTVLMFESEDDATRFGLLLEAQDYPNPNVEAFDSEEIEEICQESDYDCRLVPESTLLMPPENNVEQPEWQEDGSPGASPARASETESETRSSEMELSELEQIRRRLEGLL